MRRVVLLLLPPGLGAQQAERILSFHSELQVATDSSMVVRENIIVNAA